MSAVSLVISIVSVLVGLVGGLALYERYPFVTLERVCKSIRLEDDVKSDIARRAAEGAPALDLVKAEARLKAFVDRLEKLKARLPKDMDEGSDLMPRYEATKKSLVKEETGMIEEDVAGFCAGLTTVQGK